MARRVAGILTTIGLWSMGAVLLIGAAGFLFAAVLHRVGSDGWVIATAGTVVLSLAGTTCLGLGSWLAWIAEPSRRRTSMPNDDAMWIE